MHLRNKLFLFVVVVAMVLSLSAQTAPQQTPPATPPQNPAQAPATAPQQAPAQPTTAPQQNPQSAAPAPNQPDQQGQQGQAPAGQQGDVFVFRAEVQNVVLHATVVDDKQHIVNDLDKNAFTVFEDGQPQKIVAFSHHDIPVALGIVIDNSGSMRDKRPKVNQAAINLVKASNPEDKVFIVNFNDEYYLDQDFTSSIDMMKEALDRIESRGGTALYDAVVASADHLKKNAPANLEIKKVLLVVTDGEDNASRESLEQAIRRLQADNGPTVYTIGLLGEEKARRAKRALSALAEQTGGVAFFPKDLSEVDQISQEVAHDIRNQYTLVYKPSVPQSQGGYRTIKVEAHAKGYKNLQVRTRSGYYARQERAAVQ